MASFTVDDGWWCVTVSDGVHGERGWRRVAGIEMICPRMMETGGEPMDASVSNVRRSVSLSQGKALARIFGERISLFR